MGKNILIFSDGTGQAGGYMPDETRSNVYKLFRATRVSPDSGIDPKLQLAFYDGGLGSRAQSEAINWSVGDPTHEAFWIKHPHAAKPGLTPLEHFKK